MAPMSRKRLPDPLQPHEALGRAVRARRAELGLTQDELSERCELDRTYISGVERGRRNPTVQVLWVLARGLDTAPSALVHAAELLVGPGGGGPR